MPEISAPMVGVAGVTEIVSYSMGVSWLAVRGWPVWASVQHARSPRFGQTRKRRARKQVPKTQEARESPEPARDRRNGRYRSDKRYRTPSPA